MIIITFALSFIKNNGDCQFNLLIDYGQHGNLKRMLKIPYKVVDGKRFYLLH